MPIIGIGSSGVEALAAALKTNTCIRELKLLSQDSTGKLSCAYVLHLM